MTIQLIRHRLLPTIPEYRSDDNIKLAQAGDEMNLATTILAVKYNDQDKQSYSHSNKSQASLALNNDSHLSKHPKINHHSYITNYRSSPVHYHSNNTVTEAASATINYLQKLASISYADFLPENLYGATSLLNLFTSSTLNSASCAQNDLGGSFSRHIINHQSASSSSSKIQQQSRKTISANYQTPTTVTNMKISNEAPIANFEVPKVQVNHPSASSGFSWMSSLFSLLEDSGKFMPKSQRLIRHLSALLYKYVGRTIILMTMISFLFVGLLVNVIQLALYLTVYQVSPHLFKWFNYYLIYTVLSPVLTIAYYWANVRLNVRMAKKELLTEAFEPMLGLILLNHNFELDWLVCMVFGDQLRNLGAYKTIVKSDIKYLPIIGWSAMMSQMIFVDRVWAKDRLTMGDKLNELLDFKQTFIGLFCEGTRLTPEKHQASIKYAIANNLKPLKHHLLPRPRGFTHCVQHLIKMKGCHPDIREEHQMRPAEYNDREVPFRIFNIEIMLPSKPTFGSFMRGESFQADFYIEEVDQLKFKGITQDEEMDQLLYDVFERKDQLVEDYIANGNRWLIGYEFPFSRKMAPLIIWAIGFVFTYSVFIVLAIDLFTSLAFWSVVLLLVVSSVWLSKKVGRETKVINSSPYGSKYLKKMSRFVEGSSTAATAKLASSYEFQVHQPDRPATSEALNGTRIEACDNRQDNQQDSDNESAPIFMAAAVAATH